MNSIAGPFLLQGSFVPSFLQPRELQSFLAASFLSQGINLDISGKSKEVVNRVFGKRRGEQGPQNSALFSDLVAQRMEAHKSEQTKNIEQKTPFFRRLSPWSVIAGEVSTAIYTAPFLSYALQSVVKGQAEFGYYSGLQVAEIAGLVGFLACYLFGT